MLRQFLLDRNSERISFNGAPSVWDPSASAASSRWPSALADFIAGRKGYKSRLMAAVHTDIVEYSRLFALDDTGTVARLRNLRRGLIARALRRHQGRLVQTAGDSMLITFNSVTRAVKCAVTIQYELVLWNDVWPDDRRMYMRVGVDLGDVISDGTDFHGDGVIVAARLQAICPPGGVCI